MSKSEEIIRQLYAAAEGQRLDVEKFVSMFSEDGYMWDMANGMKLRGHAIGDAIAGLARAFPNVQRELLKIYVVGGVVIVELATKGTHEGDLLLPSGTLASTGKVIDVPSCDVFHLDEQGKVISFHCYNEASVMQQQLGAAGSA